MDIAYECRVTYAPQPHPDGFCVSAPAIQLSRIGEVRGMRLVVWACSYHQGSPQGDNTYQISGWDMATIRSKLGHLTELDVSRPLGDDTMAYLVFLLTSQNAAETSEVSLQGLPGSTKSCHLDMNEFRLLAKSKRSCTLPPIWVQFVEKPVSRSASRVFKIGCYRRC